jgi:hypothetical protein
MSDSGGRRGRVFQNLSVRSPKLAGAYKSALRMLDSDPEPGCEAARVSIVCHCMRELMNGLTSVLADTAIPRPKPSSSALLSQLPRLLNENPDLDLNADQDVVPVPKAVAKHLHKLVGTRAREDGRNRINAAAVVTGGTDTEHPVITQWNDAYDFFLGWTHFDRNHERDRELPSDESILGAIRVVEDVVEVRTTAFFENVRSLQDLLNEINATDEGSG